MLLLAAAVAGCDLMSNGLAYTQAVEKDLQEATGVKPVVSFNWKNGRFREVGVVFPHLMGGKPIGELADTVRATVYKDFKQKPDTILMSFALAKTD